MQTSELRLQLNFIMEKLRIGSYLTCIYQVIDVRGSLGAPEKRSLEQLQLLESELSSWFAVEEWDFGKRSRPRWRRRRHLTRRVLGMFSRKFWKIILKSLTWRNHGTEVERECEPADRCNAGSGRECWTVCRMLDSVESSVRRVRSLNSQVMWSLY